ncbi:N-acetylneuraminate synthase [Thalassospira xianhensis]|uniref:AFP-like domain-containing protein n=1 Tax=Thalassospira xianhensis MCCC 1A02616 TaxID=1177929 RepID=A0A367UIB1_9PROT|nr:N-acetylneuraminate synthase [Thalassospira xianhensis]RCK07373.1 hypothetical protein TH5_03005 [Thalassospira xianhensis MCCC 1A02616]
MENVLIIAEAGVNHNGSLSLAKKMVMAAKKAGADIVKFQTGIAELIVSGEAPKADYQKHTTGATESQLTMLKKLLLPLDDFQILKNYCDDLGIMFMSTAFDMPSLDLLVKLGQKSFKVPSGEITNLPYLQKIASYDAETILSTGMADLDEINEAIDVMLAAGLNKDKLVILHCTTAYPTPLDEVNLNAMKSIQEKFGVRVGYSDHTLGIEVPIAAVALGATVIEKHFTLDRNMEGPDHSASLEPDELAQMISCVRNIEKALGNSNKAPSNSEMQNIIAARRSIHTAKPLKEGEIITEDSLIMKRPGDGISPMQIGSILGKRAAHPVSEGTKLQLQDVEGA